MTAIVAAASGASTRQTQRSQVGFAQDGREEVAEVVGHAAGEHAETLESLGLLGTPRELLPSLGLLEALHAPLALDRLAGAGD